MFYYEDDLNNEPELIDEEKFKEIFDMEWVYGDHENVHCIQDPFHMEIWGDVVPLWAYDYEDLCQKRWESCQEI